MLKLVLTLAVIVALAGCSMAVAADNQAAIDSKSYEQRAYEIAMWASVKMALYTGVQGDHYPIQVRDVKTQIQDGIKFDFTVDYSIAGQDNKSVYKTCQLSVIDIPWGNTRYFVNEVNPSTPKPVCIDSKLNY